MHARTPQSPDSNANEHGGASPFYFIDSAWDESSDFTVRDSCDQFYRPEPGFFSPRPGPRADLSSARRFPSRLSALAPAAAVATETRAADSDAEAESGHCG